MNNPVKTVLEDSLGFEIHSPTSEGLQRLKKCEDALKQLLNLQITVEEFIETLIDNEVVIDPYLDIIDRNLELFGI